LYVFGFFARIFGSGSARDRLRFFPPETCYLRQINFTFFSKQKR
jgi:hypothetical protein